MFTVYGLLFELLDAPLEDDYCCFVAILFNFIYLSSINTGLPSYNNPSVVRVLTKIPELFYF